MRLAVGAVAVLSALTVAGVPALGISLADDARRDGSTSSASPEPGGTGGPGGERASGPEQKRIRPDGKPGNGPPAHAMSRHNHPDKAQRPDEPGADRTGPDKAAKPDADENRATGQRHAAAMQRWVACVREAERKHDPATGPFRPKDVCEKPLPPGHLKRRP